LAPLPFPLLPPSSALPLEVGPLKYSEGVWGSAASSLSENEFGAF